MTCVLAIDTATDACSVACAADGLTRHVVRKLPRAHNRHLLAMVEEILGAGTLMTPSHIVAGIGPGSFTGLRIAVATVQGLAWARGLPVFGFCSLHSQAIAAVHQEALQDGLVLSVIDAQIDQVYGRWFELADGHLSPLSSPWLSRPEDIALPQEQFRQSFHLVGNGGVYGERLAPASNAISRHDDCRPCALAMASSVLDDFYTINWVSAAALAPRYVQEDVGWKKVGEQGKHD